MEFISDQLQQYLDTHSAQEPKLLQQLNRETHQKVLQPRMLSGAYQGRILSLLSKLTKPKNILEIGTYTGYASLCLAEGMTAKGRLDTIDCNEELVKMQRKYFDLSPYGDRIYQHLGLATEILPKLSGPYDLVFMDADKENYPLDAICHDGPSKDRGGELGFFKRGAMVEAFNDFVFSKASTYSR